MMKKIILTFAAVVVALTVFAGDGHKHFKTTKAEKIVAITILAEARGEGTKGMYAVAAVIAQRANERKVTPSQVCLQRLQFSCWNGKSVKDLEHLLKVPQAKYALLLARNVSLLSREYVGFANHYHNNKIKTPYWAKGKRPVKIIGNHLFYKL
jgi:spore germination cell wall hydrolase CwlJ-like protein